jgi:hypothetical protein
MACVGGVSLHWRVSQALSGRVNFAIGGMSVAGADRKAPN